MKAKSLYFLLGAGIVIGLLCLLIPSFFIQNKPIGLVEKNKSSDEDLLIYYYGEKVSLESGTGLFKSGSRIEIHEGDKITLTDEAISIVALTSSELEISRLNEQAYIRVKEGTVNISQSGHDQSFFTTLFATKIESQNSRLLIHSDGENELVQVLDGNAKVSAQKRFELTPSEGLLLNMGIAVKYEPLYTIDHELSSENVNNVHKIDYTFDGPIELNGASYIYLLGNRSFEGEQLSVNKSSFYKCREPKAQGQLIKSSELIKSDEQILTHLRIQSENPLSLKKMLIFKLKP